MNKVYRLVWSRVVNGWVCCAEITRGCGKSSSSRSLVVGVVAMAGSALFSPAMAAPSGGVVSAGGGTISQIGSITTIDQSTQNLAINWQSFDIGANEAVSFNQPNSGSIALNRVTGQDPSQILGSLSANGQVFVLNPNGVLFGQGAQVNVGGLVATTLGLSDADLLAGNTTFSGSGGSVINQGSLTATQGGYIALLAPDVLNEGVISATKGTALLGAGDKVTLNLNNGSLVSYSVDQGALNALAENRQLIEADGGQVYLSASAADALSTAVVNNSGIIQARTLQNINGTIMLMGDMQNGTVNVDGTLDASAADGGSGGFIETSAAHVQVADSANVTTLAASGESGTWLIDPVDFTIAASGGDITGAAVTSALGSGNVTIQSVLGSTGTAGDINVNDSVFWVTNTLTLSAQNDININAYMRTTTGGLALEFGLGAPVKTIDTTIYSNVDVVIFNTSNINVASGAKVDLGSSATYTTRQGSDGFTRNYAIITTLGAEGSTTGTDLQGMYGNSYNYVLGADIDATVTSSWNGGAGFMPIGDRSVTGPFAGSFDGLGHTITNLTINRPSMVDVGLFGLTFLAEIRNIGLVGGSITGDARVGTLVGWSEATDITHSYATGSVHGVDNLGGLVGVSTYYLYESLTANSLLTKSRINNSFATGSVTLFDPSGTRVTSNHGGLVGVNEYSEINSSYATGNLNSLDSSYVGGLVGRNTEGFITHSYATGNINGTDLNFAGGLVGTNDGGRIANSYASGSVYGGAAGIAVGGLVGTNGDWLTSVVDPYNGSFARSTISNSYATGYVESSINYSGGLVGINLGAISSSYWDTTTSGHTTSQGGTGLTSEQMMNLSSFSGWDIANTGGSGATWRIYEGHTAPLLTSFLSELTLTDAPDVSATYNGTVQSGNTTATTGVLGSAASGTDAGFHNGYYSTQQGYDLIGGNLTINRALLSVSADDQSRLYGEVNPILTQTLSGFVNGETLATSGVTGTATGSTTATQTTNVGTAAIVASTVGLSSTNYDFVASPSNGTLTIDKAHLTVTADDQSRLYGGVNPALTTTLSGFVNSETLATSGVSGTGSATTTANAVTNAGSAVITADVGSLTAGNYDFTTLVDGTLTIDKAHLTVTADDQSRLYGETNPTLTQTLSGFVNGETLATSGVTGTATGSTTATQTTNVGSAAIVASTAGLSATNYDFVASASDATLTIDKAHLTVTADDQSRFYGGLNPALTMTLSGFVNGETLATSGVTGTATGSTTATASTSMGSVAIVASSVGLSAGNYDFTRLVDGTLSITAPPYSISPAVAEAIIALPGSGTELLPVFGNVMAAEATPPEPVVMAMAESDESLSTGARPDTSVQSGVAGSATGQAAVTLVGDGIRLPENVLHSLREE